MIKKIAKERHYVVENYFQKNQRTLTSGGISSLTM